VYQYIKSALIYVCKIMSQSELTKVCQKLNFHKSYVRNMFHYSVTKKD